MGLTMGVVAAPCIGPFVLGLLTWVAGMGSPCRELEEITFHDARNRKTNKTGFYNDQS